MPRTPGEKEKTEKRIRTERILIPVLCVLAVSAFIIISAILGKDRVKESSSALPTEEPLATVSPCREIIDLAAESFRGDIKESGDSVTLTFKSSLDGGDVAVSSYMSNGEVCLRIVRSADPGSFKVIIEPDVTQSIFVVDQTESAGETVSYQCRELSEELAALVSKLDPGMDTDELAVKLDPKLAQLMSGEQKKASIILGGRMIELEFSEADRILKVKAGNI